MVTALAAASVHTVCACTRRHVPGRPLEPMSAFSHRDLRRLGVTLVGHQKKIMNSLQEVKVQLVNGMVPL